MIGGTAGAVKTAQVVLLVVFGVLALAVTGAFATYPSWQLAVAAVCALAAVPVLVVIQRQMRASPPLRPGVPARTYVAAAGTAVVWVVLIAVVAVMFSIAPVG